MVNKPHRVVELATPTNIVHQSDDGKVTEKKRPKRDIPLWNEIWGKEQEKYK